MKKVFDVFWHGSLPPEQDMLDAGRLRFEVDMLVDSDRRELSEPQNFVCEEIRRSLS